MGWPLTSGPSTLETALTARCPRCGKGRLFEGVLSVRPVCAACGLDLSAQDAGDGPAVFVILFLGAAVVGLALWVEVKLEPPLWLHAVLWTPVIVAGAVGLLRVLKAWLIAMQFRHRRMEAGS